MTSSQRLTVVAVVLALVPAAALALPYGAQITQIEDDHELRFRVDVYALEMAVNPPDEYLVVRRNTAPGMFGPRSFTVWHEFPPNGETYHSTFLDEQVQGLDTGLYEVRGRWESGAEEILDAEWFALVEHPYVLRGALLSASAVEACTGNGLLECAEVELANPDWWTDIGPGVLLDIYGWPVRLDGRTDCKVFVTWVEPMPAGADCGDPMALEAQSWTTVRAKYR